MAPMIPVVHPIPVLKDNYVWLIETDPGQGMIVDPGEAAPVMEVLHQRRLIPTHILLTHHHHDHIGGVESLARHFGAKVVGSLQDAGRLPPLDLSVREGGSFSAGSLSCEVLETPGHTLGHVCYRIGDALFTGDTLFSLGCGRLFEGTAAMMWQSLLKIRGLAGVERLFPAHEYTLLNLGFVLKLDRDNSHLGPYRDWIFAQTDRNQPTLPTTMERERLCNPFLRADDADLKKVLAMDDESPVEIFAHVRTLRNQY
ncbi:MAG: hydroxyacylglutathione hydrolase [Magnetococcales bacterium]|nr:hydroxyacylglutathione hydrolase [Magnetococcales bacterium]